MKKAETTNIPGIGDVKLTKDGWLDKRGLKKPLRDIVDKMKEESEKKTIDQQKKAVEDFLKNVQKK